MRDQDFGWFLGGGFTVFRLGRFFSAENARFQESGKSRCQTGFSEFAWDFFNNGSGLVQGGAAPHHAGTPIRATSPPIASRVEGCLHGTVIDTLVRGVGAAQRQVKHRLPAAMRRTATTASAIFFLLGSLLW